MRAAAIPEANESYKYDIFDTSRLDAVPHRRLKYLKAFLMQVAQLEGAETRDRLPGPFERHVLSTGIIQRGESQKGVIDLLARYRDEWMAIVADAGRNHLSWANWLARPPRAQHAQGVTYASASQN